MLLKKYLNRILVFSLILIIALPSLPFLASADSSYKDIKIKAETTTKINLGYSYAKDYKVTIRNTKIAKVKGSITAENYQSICTIKGLKKGNTKAIVYLRNKRIGSFKIRVTRADASIKKKYRNLALKYNSHGSNAYMSESHIYVNDLIKNPHPKGKYTVFIADHNIISNTSDGNIYTVSKGSTNLTVYEKIKGQKKRNLGTVSVKVKNAKMAYVVKENRKFYPDGIFGKGNKYECLHIDGSDNFLNIQKRIRTSLINNIYTGSAFTKSEYKIKYESLKPAIATVDKKGIVTAQKVGTTKIRYTINFSDGSRFVGYCHISVEKSIT